MKKINNIQKKKILKLLSIMEDAREFNKSYLISYIDYFEPYNDRFTDFNCEKQEGKKAYRELIDKLLFIDVNAKAFVEVYGKEDEFIYADTLILCSHLPKSEISALFNETDIFPSDIGQIDDLKNDTYILNENGSVIQAKNILDISCNVFYCWWD